MNRMLMLDVGWGLGVILLGMRSLVIFVPLTILVETLIIRKYLSLRFWKSFIDAIVMNIISGLLGLILLVLIGPYFTGGEYDYNSTDEGLIFEIFRILGYLYILSVIVEGIILSFMERKSPLLSVWVIVFLSNLASYAGLFAVGVLYVLS